MMARIIIITLFSLFFLNFNPSLRAHQNVQQASLVGGELQSNSRVYLRDAWYNYMQNHSDWSDYPVTGNGPFEFINYQSTGRVSLHYTGAADQYYASPWTLEVTYRVKARSSSGLILYDQEDQLDIHYDPGFGTTMADLAVREYPEAYLMEVEIISLNNTTGQNPLPNDFMLEVQIDVNRFFRFDPYANSSIPQIIGDHSADIITTGDYQTELYWSFVPGAEEYELQYVFVEDELFDSSQSPEDLLDFDNATRIITPDPYFKTHLAYESGTLFYRVRAIGRQGEGFEHLLYGEWSHDENSNWSAAGSPKIVFGTGNINPYEDNLNWTYQITHAEYGKHAEVVSFFSDGGQIKQTVTKDNATNLTIIGESFLDYEGRSALSVLPSPVLPDGVAPNSAAVVAAGSPMQYYPNFTRVASPGNAPFGKADFDANDNRHDPPGLFDGIGSSGNYYSSNNPLKNFGFYRYLPSAVDGNNGAYNYTRTLYDDNGRVAEQSGVGPDFKIGSDHSTRYFYDRVSQSKLDRLFGVEVGYSDYYGKVITQDANGQFGVSYENLSGQVIATSLIGNPPKAGDSGEDMVASVSTDVVGEDIFGLVNQPMTEQNFYNEEEQSWNIHYQKLVTSPGIHSFTYRIDLSQEQFTAACGTDNYNCRYQLLLKILDPNKEVFGAGNTEVNISIPNSGLSYTEDISNFPITLNATNIYDITFMIDLNKVGYFTIIKELSLDQNQLETHLSTFQTHLDANVGELCFTPIVIGDGICQGLGYGDGLNAYGEYASCEELLEVLIEDMAPGGQYFDNEYFGQMDPMFINSWLLGKDGAYPGPNLFGPALEAINVASFNQVKTIINNAGLTDSGGNPITVNITLVEHGWDAIRLYYDRIEALRDYLSDEVNGWPLYKYHPEYPHHIWCKDYEDTMIGSPPEALKDVDAEFNNTLIDWPFANNGTCNVCDNQDELEPFDCPQSGTGFSTIIEMDPYFSSEMGSRLVSGTSGGQSLTGAEFLNFIFCSYPGYIAGNNRPNSMWELAVDLAGERITTGPPTPKDIWEDFVRLYLGKKQEIMHLQRNTPCNRINYAPYLYDKTDQSDPTNPVFPDYTADYPRTAGLWGTEPYCVGGPSFPNLTSIYGVLSAGCTSPADHIVPEVKAIVDDADWSDPSCTIIDPANNRQLFITDQRAAGFKIRVPDVRKSMLETVDDTGNGIFDAGDAFNDFEAAVNAANPCIHGTGFYVGFPQRNGEATGTSYRGGVFQNFFVNSSACSNSEDISNNSCTIDLANETKLYPDFESFYWDNIAFFDCIVDGINNFPNTAYKAEHTPSHLYITRHTVPFEAGIDFRLSIGDCNSCLFDGNGGLLAGCYDLTRPCEQVIPHCLCQELEFANYIAEENGISNPSISDITALYAAEFGGLAGDWTNFITTLTAECAIINNVNAADNDVSAAIEYIERLASQEEMPAGNNAPIELGCFDFEPDPCEEEEDIGDFHEDQANAEIIQQLREDFKRDYRNLCMSLDPETIPDEMNMTYIDREYHFTLYYYTPAGNLYATVPPEGVKVITSQNNNPLANKVLVAAIDEQRDNWGSTNVLYECGEDILVPEHRCNDTRNNQLMTLYKYDSYNSVVENISPDQTGTALEGDGELEYGNTRFIYDKLGRIRFSQNPRQAEASLSQTIVSYMNYDDQGRVIETGEFACETNLGMPCSWSEMEGVANAYSTYPGDALNEYKTEVTRTFYDEAESAAPIVAAFGNDHQKNLRQRVTGTKYYPSFDPTAPDLHSHATYYNYDTRGNVTTVLQEDKNTYDPNGWIKRLDYDFGIVDGLVRKFHFQKGAEDAFSHEYCYDANNRLIQTYTTEKGIIRDLDAAAFYRFDGPMARTEIGNYKVQGMDYVYNLQGWIKGINSTTLDGSRDGGNDGFTASDNYTLLHRQGARDAYGYSLHYYIGDYDPIHDFGPGNNHFAATFPTTTGGDTYDMFGGLVTSLYNGNISAMQTAMAKPGGGQLDFLAKGYYYDQLHRIVNSYTASATTASSVASGNAWNDNFTTFDYETSYSYDRNGNLLSLARNATNGSAALQMDDLSYHYTESGNGLIHNRLGHVGDNVLPALFTNDVDPQNVNNYTYDRIGNLIADASENIQEIKWRIDGKVKEIIRTPGISNSSEDIEFRYDSQGNRIEKIRKPKDAAGNLLPQNEWTSTLYVRDGQGNTIAIYDRAYQYYSPLALADISRYGGEEYLVVKKGTAVSNSLDISSLQELTLSGTPPSGWTDQYLESTQLKEYHLYSDSRLGLKKKDKLLNLVTFRATINSNVFDAVTAINRYDVQTADRLQKRLLGEKYYELSNHLGNVLAVVTDKPLAITVDGSSLDHYEADVVSTNDYYPFGMAMGERSNFSPTYRYGFNGKEKDESGEWGTLTHYDYGFRIYNPGIGKFLSVDPLTAEYPFYSPYHFAGNMPIIARDLDGREPDVVNGRLVGYFVQAGQGPSQIAKDINDPAIQKKYGFCLFNKIEWTQVVYENLDRFPEKNGGDNGPGWLNNRDDINDPEYRRLNVNEGERLTVTGDCDDCGSPVPDDPITEIPGPTIGDPEPVTIPDVGQGEGGSGFNWRKWIPATGSISGGVSGHYPTPLGGTGPGGHVGLSANWIIQGENASFIPATLTLDYGFGWGLGVPSGGGSVTARWYTGDPDNINSGTFNSPSFLDAGGTASFKGFGISISQHDGLENGGKHIGLTVPVGKSKGFGVHTSNSKQLLPIQDNSTDNEENEGSN